MGCKGNGHVRVVCASDYHGSSLLDFTQSVSRIQRLKMPNNRTHSARHSDAIPDSPIFATLALLFLLLSLSHAHRRCEGCAHIGHDQSRPKVCDPLPSGSETSDAGRSEDCSGGADSAQPGMRNTIGKSRKIVNAWRRRRQHPTRGYVLLFCALI